MRYQLLMLLLSTMPFFAQARENSPATNHTTNAETVVVNAGKDTIVYKNQTRPDSIFLDGSASSTGQVYLWEQISGPAGAQIQTPDALTSWVTGTLPEGYYQFKLTVNNSVADTVTAFIRDWQKKGIYPCRAGYDTASRQGGMKIILEPNYKGTYIKPDGTSGTWNQWNYITDVRGYVQSTKKVALYGGDTLLMEGADSTVWIELGGFGGDQGCPVYLMPRTKPVHIRGTNGFFRIANRDSNVAQHVVVDGTVLRSSGYPYGFVFDNGGSSYAGNEGFKGGWVANFTLKGLHTAKTNALKIKQDPTTYLFSRFDKWIQRNIVITDNWIDSSSNEGLYIGSSASDGGQTAYGPPIRMQNVSITNNLLTNCKWDGIQLANAKTGNEIRHNLVYKVGTANQTSQRAGILLGGNTTGVVDSNLVINSKGDGIQVFGYDAVNVYHNIIDSIYGGSGDQDGMYQSFITFVTEPNNTPLSVYNYNNLVSRVERNMIRIANNNGLMLPGHTHHNTFIHPTATDANSLIITNVKGDVLDYNTVVHNFPYTLNKVGIKDNGITISLTQADTTQAFASPKAALDWLFQRLASVSGANTPPVAQAGADMQITLPTDSVLLSGSGTDAGGGSITGYQWTTFSGPNAPLLATPDKPQTLVKNLVEGTYSFELQVTDNGGLAGKDTVQVTVAAVPNTPPVADAGPDQTITLPTNSVTLTGSGTDGDGSITAYSWTKVSGPAQGSITDPTSATTTATNLAAGSYLFRITVTDNRGATASDDVTITVNSSSVTTTTKLINVNIYGGTNPYNNSAWNDWNIRTKSVKNVTSSSFKYSDGSTSAISATLSNSSDLADNGASYGSGMAPAQVLRYTSYYTSNRTLTLKGLSATKKYTIELYASRNVSGGSTIFTINGASQTIATYNNFTTKATFANLSPSSTGQIVISISKSGSYNCVNGFAVTETATVTTSINAGALTEVVPVQEPTIASDESFELYPNPVQHQLMLKVANNHVGILTVQIVSTSGSTIRTLQLTKGQQQGIYVLPVQGLSSGVYLLQLQMDNWRATRRFLKL